MELKVFKTDLQDVVDNQVNIISSINALPILDCIKFVFTKDTLQMTVSNLEITVIEEIKCESENEGSFCVDARMLKELLKVLSPQELTIVIEDNLCLINTNTGVYKMPTSDVNDFPNLTDEDEFKHICEIPSETLKKTIEHGLICVSTDELRIAMCGMLFEIGESKVSGCCTDAHRLFQYEFPITTVTEESFIVPTKAIKYMKDTLNVAQISFSKCKDKLLVSDSSQKIFIRCIDAKFPTYSAVVPSSFSKEYNVSKSELVTSLKRVSLFSESSRPTVIFDFNKDKLTLKAEDLGQNKEAQDVIKMEENKSEEIRIGFNGKYMLDILGKCDGSTITFKLNEPHIDAIISFEKDKNYLFLLMPTMLND